MNSIEAAKIGREKVLKSTGVVIAIYLLVNIYQETRGDFGNGILFFFQDVLNIYFFIVLSILFILTYIFGGKAGKDIILNKKNIIVTAVKFAVIIAIMLNIFPLTATLIKNGLQSDYTTQLVKQGLIVTVSLLIVWIWAAFRIRSIKVN